MKKFVFLGILLTVLLPLITGCNLYDDTVNDLDNIEIFIPDDFFSNRVDISDEDSNTVTIQSRGAEDVDETLADVFAIADSQVITDIDSIDVSDNLLTQDVWIPISGKKYHKTAECSNMKSPTSVSLTEAVNKGYEPCKKCYKQ